MKKKRKQKQARKTCKETQVKKRGEKWNTSKNEKMEKPSKKKKTIEERNKKEKEASKGYRLPLPSSLPPPSLLPLTRRLKKMIFFKEMLQAIVQQLKSSKKNQKTKKNLQTKTRPWTPKVALRPSGVLLVLTRLTNTRRDARRIVLHLIISSGLAP